VWFLCAVGRIIGITASVHSTECETTVYDLRTTDKRLLASFRWRRQHFRHFDNSSTNRLLSSDVSYTDIQQNTAVLHTEDCRTERITKQWEAEEGKWEEEEQEEEQEQQESFN